MLAIGLLTWSNKFQAKKCRDEVQRGLVSELEAEWRLAYLANDRAEKVWFRAAGREVIRMEAKGKLPNLKKIVKDFIPMLQTRFKVKLSL